MPTIIDIIEATVKKRKTPDEGGLRHLPFKNCFIYGRVSTPGQVRDSRESIREIGRLVQLAIKDGYQTALDPGEIETELDSSRGKAPWPKVWSDGKVTVDVRDLGLSGQLSTEERRGLFELQRRVREGTVGAVYLTEGVSRLSRDRDHILPYQLLKLLKEHQCRIRTPEGIWNPAIERDWDYLADEFEEAIGELKVMNRRMFRRKRQKAARGEYVGEPIPPGFFLPVTGRKPGGEYEYGKLKLYPPHAEIVRAVLEEYVNQNGSKLRTLRGLNDLTFPLFPPDLQYMERLTSLRTCPRINTGYKITSTLIRGLVKNPKMIGVWQWGDTEAIIDNHPAVVPEDLFIKAWQLASQARKPKGKTVYFEPNEWAGLLRCMNHTEPHRIVSLNARGRYTCRRDYLQEGAGTCLDIAKHFIDEPLTTTVLQQLDLTPFTDHVLDELESMHSRPKFEERQKRLQIRQLNEEIQRWQALLPCCVDGDTGSIDREKEEFYWGKIREAKDKLEEIIRKPITQDASFIDYQKVREFLKCLRRNWKSYSPTSRSRLLRSIIESVEVRGQQEIEATIIWKTGFRQKVVIHRPRSNSKMERRWTKEADDLLALMFPRSSQDALVAAFPDRTWKAINYRARRLGQQRKLDMKEGWKKWTQEDDAELERYYLESLPNEEISRKMGRNISSISARIRMNGLGSDCPQTKNVYWQSYELIASQESASGRGSGGWAYGLTKGMETKKLSGFPRKRE